MEHCYFGVLHTSYIKNDLEDT